MTKEPKNYRHLQEPTTVQVNDHVTMLVAGGEISFWDHNHGHRTTMSEWDLGVALDTYMYKKVNERFEND